MNTESPQKMQNHQILPTFKKDKQIYYFLYLVNAYDVRITVPSIIAFSC